MLNLLCVLPYDNGPVIAQQLSFLLFDSIWDFLSLFTNHIDIKFYNFRQKKLQQSATAYKIPSSRIYTVQRTPYKWTIKLRSPKTLSTLLTVGQNLASLTQGAGYAACSRPYGRSHLSASTTSGA